MQILNNFIPIADKPHYRKKMETSIKGVRTELLAELALENMGFEVVRATTEQDKRGIDYLITDSQGKQTAIDSKSSRFNANKTNDRNAKYYNDGTIAICPFSPETLESIHTVLPKDPYGEMLQPSEEMLANLYTSGIVDKHEYTRIMNELERQMKDLRERNNNPASRGKLVHV